MLFFLSIACKAPEAPEEYEALVGFLFEHTADEQDDYIEVGLANLNDWLRGEDNVRLVFSVRRSANLSVKPCGGPGPGRGVAAAAPREGNTGCFCSKRAGQ